MNLGGLATDNSCCCNDCVYGCNGCKYAVLVLNCNGITDDDLELSLDGASIDTIVEVDLTCTTVNLRGALFLPTGMSELCDVDFDLLTCGGTTPATINITNSGLLDNITTDPMVFTLNSVQDNGCGNFGTFYVWRICDSTSKCCLIYTNQYDNTENTFSIINPCGG